MDFDFIPLPHEVESLQKKLAEKEKIIEELLLENSSLKQSIISDSMEELNVEVDENAETIELKQFDDENDDDDDEGIPSLGENVNQDDFLNILRMLMSQGTQETQGTQGTYGSGPSLSLYPSLDQGQEDEEQGQEDEEQGQEDEEQGQEDEEQGEEDENIIDDIQVD
jgi:hypothetical protein